MLPQTANRKATLFRSHVNSEFRSAADVVVAYVRELLQLPKLGGVQTLNHSSSQFLINCLHLRELNVELSLRNCCGLLGVT